MTRPLSIDLRERLVLAAEGGMSRRSAATRFGVAASTAIKWVDRWRQSDDARLRPLGGDKRSHRIEAHAGKSWRSSKRRRTSPWGRLSRIWIRCTG